MRRVAASLVLFLSPACSAPGRPIVTVEPTSRSAIVEESSSPSSADTAQPLPLPAAPSSALSARVVAVTDGDTVVLSGIEFGEIHRATGGRKSRIIGVDTPEVFGGADCYGAEASAFTRHELSGTRVLVDFDVDPVDRFGRALVYIWDARGRFFNGRLAQEGYALQLTVPPNVRYAELFTHLVREAREANKGLWTGCPVVRR